MALGNSIMLYECNWHEYWFKYHFLPDNSFPKICLLAHSVIVSILKLGGKIIALFLLLILYLEGKWIYLKVDTRKRNEEDT